MGKVIAISGAQFGDEGKGKVVDYLGKTFKIAVRYNGGNNAGHSVVSQDLGRQKVHLLPAIAYRPGAVCVLGCGMVIDLKVLAGEIAHVKSVNPSVTVLVDERAHVITESHKEKDRENEANRSTKIGTTSRGIGPAYADKMYRTGIRICDLPKNMIKNLRVINASGYLNDAIDRGEDVLFAGAHGSMLDIDHGTYPYVTSSNCISSGVGTGAGVSPRKIDEIIGVTKAYETRVGGGPFFTKMPDEIADKVREKGHEYGTTTGRPRHIAWMNMVNLRYTARINNYDCLSLSMLDVLSKDITEEVKICTAIIYKGDEYKEYLPAEMNGSEEVGCVYEIFKSWEGSEITDCKHFDDLPYNASKFIERIEALTGIRVGIISTGPGRDQVIDRR